MAIRIVWNDEEVSTSTLEERSNAGEPFERQAAAGVLREVERLSALSCHKHGPLDCDVTIRVFEQSTPDGRTAKSKAFIPKTCCVEFKTSLAQVIDCDE